MPDLLGPAQAAPWHAIREVAADRDDAAAFMEMASGNLARDDGPAPIDIGKSLNILDRYLGEIVHPNDRRVVDQDIESTASRGRPVGRSLNHAVSALWAWIAKAQRPRALISDIAASA